LELPAGFVMGLRDCFVTMVTLYPPDGLVTRAFGYFVSNPAGWIGYEVTKRASNARGILLAPCKLVRRGHM
jgi:hypothetical protein